MKKECAKFIAWMSKRGLTGNDFLTLVNESNLSEAPSSSWWLDSGAVTPRNLYRYKLWKIIMTGICIGISYGK